MLWDIVWRQVKCRYTKEVQTSSLIKKNPPVISQLQNSYECLTVCLAETFFIENVIFFGCYLKNIGEIIKIRVFLQENVFFYSFSVRKRKINFLTNITIFNNNLLFILICLYELFKIVYTSIRANFFFMNLNIVF